MIPEYEKDVEQYLKRGVEGLGGRCIKLTCPGFRFMPDRMVFFIHARLFFIEAKRSTRGRVHSGQLRRVDWLQDWGFAAGFIFNKGQVDQFLEEIKCGYLTTERFNLLFSLSPEQRAQIIKSRS